MAVSNSYDYEEKVVFSVVSENEIIKISGYKNNETVVFDFFSDKHFEIESDNEMFDIFNKMYECFEECFYDPKDLEKKVVLYDDNKYCSDSRIDIVRKKNAILFDVIGENGYITIKSGKSRNGLIDLKPVVDILTETLDNNLVKKKLKR